MSLQTTTEPKENEYTNANNAMLLNDEPGKRSIPNPTGAHGKFQDRKAHCKQNSEQTTIGLYGQTQNSARKCEVPNLPLSNGRTNDRKASFPPQTQARPLTFGDLVLSTWCKDVNRIYGMTASDIDKYSRILFPVTFTCFQLMYWIIYLHLGSYDIMDDIVYLHPNHV